jgi:uncharacterized membrane protein
MRRIALPLVVFAVLSVPAWAAMPVGTASGGATPNAAGAKPARLKVSVDLELKCAKPGPAAIVAALPRAWRVPKAISRSAAWIDSTHPKSLTVSGHTMTLAPVAPAGTCNAIAPGTIVLRFTRAAKLGNPRKAGRYTIHVTIGTQTFSAQVAIKPAA